MKRLVLVFAIVFAFGVTYALNNSTNVQKASTEQVSTIGQDEDDKDKKEAKAEDKKECSEKKASKSKSCSDKKASESKSCCSKKK